MIFNTCLFYCDKNLLEVENIVGESNDNDTLPLDYVKTKSSDSRKVAYELLENLLQNSTDNIQSFFKNSLSKLIEVIPERSKYDFKPSNHTKSIYGYVGIYNLGCICYMNAML